MAFDSKIENVRSIMLNLDMECYVDMVEGRGIRLTSVDSFTKKNEKIREGLQSDFFGTDFGDENAYAERYACKCRKYVGKMYEGKICECCNTPVEYSDTDLSKTGWIILDKYHVISPIYAAKLSDALGTSDGEKVLDKILKIKRPDDDDVNENPIIAFTDKELVELKKHPFMYKGEIWLKDHLEEVLDYYIAKKPAKKKLLQQIKNNISDVWTKCIPVYSAALRTELPGVKGNKLFKIRINTYYQSIIRIVNFINEYKANDLDNNEEIVINKQLAAIQAEIADVFNETCKELTGKKGIIISKVMG